VQGLVGYQTVPLVIVVAFLQFLLLQLLLQDLVMVLMLLLTVEYNCRSAVERRLRLLERPGLLVLGSLGRP